MRLRRSPSETARSSAFLLFIAALTGMFFGGLMAWYIGLRLSHRPLHPDAIHVVPFDNHGAIHYMERVEGF